MSIEVGHTGLSKSHRIHIIRGEKVLLDSDLAELYSVPRKAFNQAVRRNMERFPQDFMFRLTNQEVANMRSQIVTASKRNVRYQPLAFTEHGVVMLSAVLCSPRAVQMSIFIIRAFIRLRELIAANKDLAARSEKLEEGQGKLEAGQRQTSSIIEVLVDEIDGIAREVKDMKALPEPHGGPVGCHVCFPSSN